MRTAIVEAAALQAPEGSAAPPWTGLLTRQTIDDEGALEQACRHLEPELERDDRRLLSNCRSYGERIAALFEIVAQPCLSRLHRTPDGTRELPVFVTEFPVEDSPLARRNERDPRFVDRFELFAQGREVANAFSELNDPDDQAARFKAQFENKQRGSEEAMDFDEDYVRALQHGMPPTAGAFATKKSPNQNR
jgi:lysyl-tRNA synthetase class II